MREKSGRLNIIFLGLFRFLTPMGGGRTIVPYELLEIGEKLV